VKLVRTVRADPFFAFRVAMACLVPLLLAGLVYLQIHGQDERQHDRDMQLAENRVASCVQTNVLIDGARHAIIGGAEGLLAISTQFTDEQKATISRVYREAVEGQLPFRDCSPAGIADYFHDPPPDPGAK
jgi:hypothetical protein